MGLVKGKRIQNTLFLPEGDRLLFAGVHSSKQECGWNWQMSIILPNLGSYLGSRRPIFGPTSAHTEPRPL